jgi:hypothetical protein
MTKKEQVMGKRCWNQPAVQADSVAAGKPDILKWEIQVHRCLFYNGVGKKGLAFDKPIPGTAKKTQKYYPQ